MINNENNGFLTLIKSSSLLPCSSSRNSFEKEEERAGE
jgi:hypothetical protein